MSMHYGSLWPGLCFGSIHILSWLCKIIFLSYTPFNGLWELEHAYMYRKFVIYLLYLSIDTLSGAFEEI